MSHRTTGPVPAYMLGALVNWPKSPTGRAVIVGREWGPDNIRLSGKVNNCLWVYTLQWFEVDGTLSRSHLQQVAEEDLKKYQSS